MINLTVLISTVIKVYTRVQINSANLILLKPFLFVEIQANL